VSQFLRQESPPAFDRTERYRPFLRRDFRCACAYCERPESFLGGEEFYEIDHFRPVKRFPELEFHYPNLYYACGKCNRHKSGTWPAEELMERGFRFSGPCQEDMYSVHLEEERTSKLHPLTNVGTYTCAHIRLNRPDLLAWRQERRRRDAELQELKALGEKLRLAVQTISEPGLRQELHHLIAVLDSKIAWIRQLFSL
jgi:hypothetical protein